MRNAAPVAGTLMGGPAGLALAGLGSAAGRAVSPGSNIGDILKSGVSGASMAGIGMAGKSALSGLMERGGAEAGAELAGNSLDDLAGGAVPEVGLTPSAPSAMEAIGSAAQSAAPEGGKSFLSRVGSFIEKRPTASAMALKGIGDIASAPSENRYNDARARSLDLETQMQQDEMERRRRLEASLEPIRLMLAQQLNAPRSPVAPNPYSNG